MASTTKIGELTTPAPDVLADDALESTRWWIHQAASWAYLCGSSVELGQGREELQIRLRKLTECLQHADKLALGEES